MIKQLAFILPAAVLVAIGCSSNDEPSVDCSTQSISYSTTVAPIITTSCATNSSCHGSGSSHGPGALTNYSAVLSNRAAIRSAVASGSMPKNSSLTTDQKNSILCWIDNGAQNNWFGFLNSICGLLLQDFLCCLK